MNSLEIVKSLKEKLLNNFNSVIDKDKSKEYFDDAMSLNEVINSLKILGMFLKHVAILDYNKDTNKYYFFFEGGFGFECSKEEYDLLKEVLK